MDNFHSPTESAAAGASNAAFTLDWNPPLKAATAALCAIAAVFIALFFAGNLDAVFSAKLLHRAALVCLPFSAAAFAGLFVMCMVGLFKSCGTPKIVLALLAALVVAQTGWKVSTQDKLPLRSADEAEMVLHGKYVWRDVAAAFSPGGDVVYSPFRPHGHSIPLSAAAPFGGVTFGSASVVNSVVSGLTVAVVFLLTLVLFGRPWLALLSAFFMSVNSVFAMFSVTSDYCISALFYSLTADLFVAAFLRRGGRVYLFAGMAALALAVQSRPEYVLYPAVIAAYIFLMARPAANRTIAAGLLFLIPVIPHFLSLCYALKTGSVVNYVNDAALFTADTLFGKIAQMVSFNARLFPEWIWKNGTSPALYALALLGIIEGARRARIQTFMLVFPMAVLLFALASGNTYSFTTINYSINFQPYLCMLSAVGVFAFARPGAASKALPATLVIALSIVAAASSLSIHRQLRASYFPTEYRPSGIPPQREVPCINQEILFLQSVAPSLDRSVPVVESFSGLLEVSTGLTKLPKPIYYRKLAGLRKVYFYEPMASRYGDVSLTPSRTIRSQVGLLFATEKVMRREICGWPVSLSLMTRKTVPPPIDAPMYLNETDTPDRQHRVADGTVVTSHRRVF